MNDIESPKFDKNEILANMVVRKFWVSRQKFSKNNQERLAKMAKVPGKEEKYVGSLEQNNRIRDRILKNNMIPLHEFSEVIHKFSPEQKTAIENTFSDNQVNTYISNLTTQQIEKIKQLTPTQLVGFLDTEMKNIQNKKEHISPQNDWIQITEKTTEQMVILDELDNVERRIDDIINREDVFNVFRKDKIKWIFTNQTTENSFIMESKKFKVANKATYMKRVELHGEQWAEKNMRTMYILQQVNKPEIQSKMNEKTKAEMNALVIEYYEGNQKLGIDFSSSDMQVIYESAKQCATERYTQNDAYTMLINNVNSDPNVTSYFENHKTTELVSESMKDKSYYTKLLLWYPTLDSQEQGKKISEYLPYLNDDMTIKASAPEEQKKTIITMIPKLREQGKPYEERLLNKTNALTQNTAIEECITTLQKYMDVDISEKDNVIQQLKIAENSDAVSSDMIFHINGMLNGKKITLSYNLLTGTVSYSSFLTKNNDTNQGPIRLSSWNTENQVPLITLPKFGDFVEEAKHSEYHALIGESQTVDEYSKNFSEHLQKSIQKNIDTDMDIQKDMLKKYIIKDMITQNIFYLTWRNIDSSTPEYLITPTAQPQSYAFYNFIQKSLEYYSMGSIEQLQWFQNTINTLRQYREWPTKTQSLETLLPHKEENQEMFALQAITNQAIISSTTSTISDQWPEEQLSSFFTCFEKQIWGIAIIDTEMMSDYLVAATGTNKKDNTVGKWKRNQAFTNMIHNLDTKVSGDQASVDLDTQLNMA